MYPGAIKPFCGWCGGEKVTLHCLPNGPQASSYSPCVFSCSTCCPCPRSLLILLFLMPETHSISQQLARIVLIFYLWYQHTQMLDGQIVACSIQIHFAQGSRVPFQARKYRPASPQTWCVLVHNPQCPSPPQRSSIIAPICPSWQYRHTESCAPSCHPHLTRVDITENQCLLIDVSQRTFLKQEIATSDPWCLVLMAYWQIICYDCAIWTVYQQHWLYGKSRQLMHSLTTLVLPAADFH